MSEKNNELTAKEIIDQMLNQTSISTKELSKILGASERSVRDIIAKFCDLHPQFKIDDFKNDKDSYEFKKEWNGILCALLSISSLSDYDKRRKKNMVENEITKLEELMKSIDSYMVGADRKFALIDSTCVQAKLELNLYDRIFELISLITIGMSKMAPFLRFQCLLSFYETLKVLPNFVSESIAFYESQLNDYKDTAKKDWPDEIGALSFCEDIHDYLLKVLRVKMDGREIEEKIYEFEVVGRSLRELQLLACFNPVEYNAMNEIMTKPKERVLEEHDLTHTMEKIKNVLDLTNQQEAAVFEWCEKVLLQQAFQREHLTDNVHIGRELLRDILIGKNKDLIKSETEK